MNFKTGNILRSLPPDNERERDRKRARERARKRERGNNRAKDQHGS